MLQISSFICFHVETNRSSEHDLEFYHLWITGINLKVIHIVVDNGYIVMTFFFFICNLSK